MHSHSSTPVKLGSSLFWSLGQRLLVAIVVLVPVWALLLWSLH